jgi:hypothetical protein
MVVVVDNVRSEAAAKPIGGATTMENKFPRLSLGGEMASS